jgi:DNA repair protein RecN (Recombination protein N)
LLRQAARRLDRIAGEHERLSEALAAIDRAVIEASEAEDKLARAAEELAFDPQRLEEAESRLFEIRAAARKHKVAPDDLPALAHELASRLQSLEAGGGRIAGWRRRSPERGHVTTRLRTRSASAGSRCGQARQGGGGGAHAVEAGRRAVSDGTVAAGPRRRVRGGTGSNSRCRPIPARRSRR